MKTSRVLAKNETVDPKLRELVEDTIRELNFRPNGLARGLRRSRSAIIGQTSLPTEAELLQATLIIRTSSAAPRRE